DLLLAHDVTHRRPPLRDKSLVILNGCQTSVRDVRAHDEGLGLMTAFLLRGASLVLATQWSVVDGCAFAFVLSFLEQVLEKGQSPTDALRHAQRHVRGLTFDDLLHRCAGVESEFPDDSVEKGKLLAQKAWLCREAGRPDEA